MIIDHVEELKMQQKYVPEVAVKKILKKFRILRLINQALFCSALKEIDFSPLIKIRASFPNARICLIHLPEKGEVMRGRYRLNLQKRIESLGISYFPALYKCYWDNSMFHNNDGHPNNYGYSKISECTEKNFFPETTKM